jgi:uncharacterized protein (DUF427 family)
MGYNPADFPDVIRNPENENHYMRAKPISRRIRVEKSGVQLADSTRALRILEVGKDLFDPVVYVPKDDVVVGLTKVENLQTHCPLKGDASYWQLAEGADAEKEWIAWSYDEPFDFASAIAGYVAFDINQVSVIENG